MFSSHFVMALLVSLATSATVAESDIAAPATCSATDEGQYFCLNCKTKAKCDATGPPVPKGECTVPGEACTVLNNVATCVPLANTECTCNTCDAYDSDSLLVCLTGGGTYSIDCTANSQTCVEGACATPQLTTTTVEPVDICVDATEDGVLVTKPMCTTGAYCIGQATEIPFDCPSGSYLDVAGKGCKPLPPAKCVGCDGACPDKSDCSKYYVCQAGAVLDEETCDGTTPFFDTVAFECVETETGCTKNDGCTYGLTTIAETTATSSDGAPTTSGSDSTTSGSDSTTSGSDSTTSGSDSTTSGTGSTGDSSTTTSRPAACTATNVGQRYPYDGDCKKYWKCAELSTGVYGWVAATCLGDYVFNPNTNYCDLQSNVPSCVLSTTVSS